jgi:hypothetical protein
MMKKANSRKPMDQLFKFEQYDNLALEKIGALIDLLTPTTEKFYEKSERFKEEYLEFEDKDSLLAKIEEEILYQRRLGERIVELSRTHKVNARRSGYYWVCSIEKERKINFLQVCLYIIAEGGKYGNILYPLDVILSENEIYRYWEVINEEDAIEAAKELMQLED